MRKLKDQVEQIQKIFTHDNFRNSLKRILFFSGGNLFAQFIMMLYAIIVARQLGPSELGIYSGLYAILGVTITFVNFGLDQWMLKEAHAHKSVQLLSGKVISIKLLLGIVWGILCLIFIPISRPGIFTPAIVLLALGDVFFDVIFNTITAAWNIERDIKSINLFLLMSRVGKFLALIGLTMIQKVSPMNIVTSRIIVSGIVLLLSLAKFKPVINLHNIFDLKQIVRRSSEFGFSEILATVYGNIDVAILSYFSITNAGLYSPATGIIHALFIIPNSFFSYLIPYYSKEISNNKSLSLKKVLKQVLLIFTVTGFALSLVLFVGGEFLVTLILGSKYLETGRILVVLSPIMLIKSISFGLALLIVITGNQKKRLLPQLVIALFNIVINILLIPKFGIFGVAWVYSLSELGLMLGYLNISLRTLRSQKYEEAKS